jgi:hypothetical protein
MVLSSSISQADSKKVVVWAGMEPPVPSRRTPAVLGCGREVYSESNGRIEV